MFEFALAGAIGWVVFIVVLTLVTYVVANLGADIEEHSGVVGFVVIPFSFFVGIAAGAKAFAWLGGG